MILHITPGERAALRLLAQGTTTDALAGHLGTTEDQAEAYLITLFAKMGAGDRDEAVAAAGRRGLLDVSYAEGPGGLCRSPSVEARAF